MMTEEQIVEVFVNIGNNLEGDYNFLRDDLIKLAKAFIEKATPIIEKKEHEACVEVVRAYNSVVADKLQEVRGK
jgi:hypothetical protein